MRNLKLISELLIIIIKNIEHNMPDNRFNRIFILKIEEDQIPQLKRLCEDYNIVDNGTFENAAAFHRIWGIGPNCLLYLSYGMAQKGFDFNSLNELESYLEKFITKN